MEQLFQVFFPIEDINPNEVTLSMTMLADLGGGNFHNLARVRLNDNVPILEDRASLLRIGLGETQCFFQRSYL